VKEDRNVHQVILISEGDGTGFKKIREVFGLSRGGVEGQYGRLPSKENTRAGGGKNITVRVGRGGTFLREKVSVMIELGKG